MNMKWIAGTVAGVVAGYMARKHMERIERLEDQMIAMQWNDEIPVDEEDVTRKYPPSMAWICDDCDALMLFHDSPERMQEHVDQVKDCDGLECPFCGGYNEIDPVTRHIMNQQTERK
jgi:hypothetical protein